MPDTRRPEDALLAGVSAEIARRLGWNVWAVRGLFVLGLVVQTLATIVIYAVLAVVMRCMAGGADRKSAPPAGLGSPDLAERGKRIEELERRFKDLERQAD